MNKSELNANTVANNKNKELIHSACLRFIEGEKSKALEFPLKLNTLYFNNIAL